jgi:hypothetical protein
MVDEVAPESLSISSVAVQVVIKPVVAIAETLLSSYNDPGPAI